MTARDVEFEVDRLLAERRQAGRTGARDNDFYLESLDVQITAARDAYIGVAVTEIATLRGQLVGRQVG